MPSFFQQARSGPSRCSRLFALALLGHISLCRGLGIPLTSSASELPHLTGHVLDPTGNPRIGATVTLTGPHLEVTTKSGTDGGFTFPATAPGQYHLHALLGALQADTDAIVPREGRAMATLLLAPLNEIGHISIASKALSSRSATDVEVNATQLARAASGNSLPSILTQLPSAARGSNGQIHINGDHNGLNYVVDGVQLPTSLNRVLGNEIDPSDIGSLEALEGAYPAEYGDHFAAVINLSTKAPMGPPGGRYAVSAGSFGSIDTTAGYHLLTNHGGSLTVGARSASTDRGIDPPVTQFTHDRSSDTSQFLRFTQPAHGQDTLNVDMLHSNQSFQIPPDTASGVPPSTDDDEYQNDTFASVQYRHDIHGHGSLSFGPSFKASQIIDTNDLNNDLAGAIGQPSCTDFTNCQFFSAYANRLARDYRFNTDYALRSAHHEIRSGILYDATSVNKHYDITLQPNSALNPNSTFTAIDTSPNMAHQQEAYLQDHWNMGKRYVLDSGVRMDAFQIFSSQFDQGFSQFSPRLKVTRVFTPRSNIYAYYGRLFEPFSFENVSPQTAAALYAPANNPGNSFDLKPERDSLYETGGFVPLGAGQLGLRISHKVATDYLDDTQVGATNIHQDINFPRGRVDVQSLSYQNPLARKGKAYFSVTHSIAVNSLSCETQLLQNCAAGGAVPGGDFVQSDHDQHWDMNGGLLFNDRHANWLSFDMEYGSGLSADPSTCPTHDAVNCKVPPHLIFSTEKGFALGQDSSISLALHNLLNDHYALTIDNSLQGTHYAQARTLFLQYRYKE